MTGPEAVVYITKAASLMKSGYEIKPENRGKIPKSQFAQPNKEEEGHKGKYPIPDKQHAKSALGFAKMHGDTAAYAAVRAKVEKKFPGMIEDKKKESCSGMGKTGAAPVGKVISKIKPPPVQPWHYHTTPQRQMFASPIAPARGQAAIPGMLNPMTVTASVKLAAFFSELQKISMPKGTLENLTKLKGSPVENVAEGALKRVRTHNIGARYARTGEWPASVPKPANLKPVPVRPNVLPPKQLGPAPGGTYTGPREVTSGFGGMEKEEGFFDKVAPKLMAGGPGGASALRAGERALSTGGRVTTGVATNYTGRVMPPPRQITSMQQNIAERGISL